MSRPIMPVCNNVQRNSQFLFQGLIVTCTIIKLSCKNGNTHVLAKMAEVPAHKCGRPITRPEDWEATNKLICSLNSSLYF